MLKQVVRAAQFTQAYLTLVRDPYKTQRVFHLVDSLGAEGLEKIPGFLQRPEVQKVMSQPAQRLRTDIPELAKLPEQTLGYAFAQHMIREGFTPEDLAYSQGDEPYERIRIHLESTHDVWHVVTGFRPDIAGELGLQAFYHGQFGATLGLVLLSAGLLNTLFFANDDADRRMAAISHGWQLGRRARPLIGVDWSRKWEMPLSQVRRELGLSTDGFALEEVLGNAA